jgi:hypothetical protein
MHLISLLIIFLLIVSLTGRNAQPPPYGLQLVVHSMLVNLLKPDTKPRNALLSKDLPVASPPEIQSEEQPVHSTVDGTSWLLAHAVVRDLVCSAVIDTGANNDRPARSDRYLMPTSAHGRRPLTAGGTRAYPLPATLAAAEETADSGPDANMMRLADHLQPELTPGVRRLHREDPNLFVMLTEKLQSRHPADLSPIDEQGKKMAGILERAFDEVRVEGGSEGGMQSQILLKEFGREDVKNWAKTYAESYLADLVSERPEPEVLDNFVYGTSTDPNARQLVAADEDSSQATNGCDP